MSITTFAFPTPIHFGFGARKQGAAHLLQAGFRRPLVVTDWALAARPVMAEFLTHLDGLAIAVFAGVFGNPTRRQVIAASKAYEAHQADCMIGFGGSAALDVARLAGLSGTLSSHGARPAQVPRLVEIATADLCHQTNPRPCSTADFERLFNAAL